MSTFLTQSQLAGCYFECERLKQTVFLILYLKTSATSLDLLNTNHGTPKFTRLAKQLFGMKIQLLIIINVNHG